MCLLISVFIPSFPQILHLNALTICFPTLIRFSLFSTIDMTFSSNSFKSSEKVELAGKDRVMFLEVLASKSDGSVFAIKYSFEVTLENFCVGFIDCFRFGEAELTFAAFSPNGNLMATKLQKDKNVEA